MMLSMPRRFAQVNHTTTTPDRELVRVDVLLHFDAQHPIYKLGEGVWQMWSTLLQEALGALDRWNPGGPSDNWGTLETRGVASHLYYALYFSIAPSSISLFHRPVFLCYTLPVFLCITPCCLFPSGLL